MRSYLFSALILTLLFSACKKGDSGGSSSSFTVNGTAYHSTTTNGSGYAGVYSYSCISGTGSTAASINFVFIGTPTTGTYRLVDNYTVPSSTQCYFVLALPGGSYASTNTDNTTITATMTNGKLNLSFTGAKGVNESNPADVVTIDGNLIAD